MRLFLHLFVYQCHFVAENWMCLHKIRQMYVGEIPRFNPITIRQCSSQFLPILFFLILSNCKQTRQSITSKLTACSWNSQMPRNDFFFLCAWGSDGLSGNNYSQDLIIPKLFAFALGQHPSVGPCNCSVKS